jgi:hypothetical protein
MGFSFSGGASGSKTRIVATRRRGIIPGSLRAQPSYLSELRRDFLASIGITYAVFRIEKTIAVLNQLSGRCGYSYIRTIDFLV